MQADEQAALAMLKDCRAAIQRAVEQHAGRIVNAPGDSILAEFHSAVEAVRCAAEIQHDLANRNSALSPEQRMEYRIGVNLGEVIEEGDGTLFPMVRRYHEPPNKPMQRTVQQLASRRCCPAADGRRLAACQVPCACSRLDLRVASLVSVSWAREH
jgi:hypothetical protein